MGTARKLMYLAKKHHPSLTPADLALVSTLGNVIYNPKNSARAIVAATKQLHDIFHGQFELPAAQAGSLGITIVCEGQTEPTGSVSESVTTTEQTKGE